MHLAKSLVLLAVVVFLPSASTGLLIPSRSRGFPSFHPSQFLSDAPHAVNFEGGGSPPSDSAVVEVRSRHDRWPQLMKDYGREWQRQCFLTKQTSRILLAFICGVLFCSPNPAWASDVATGPTKLKIRSLLAATAMLSTVGGMGLAWMVGFSGLSRGLMVSASRAALQLYLLGSFFLQRLMGTTRPWLVGLWIVGVGFVAGREAFSRVQYSYPRMNYHVYMAVLAGGLSVLGMAVGFNVFGAVDPWYQPRTLIPVAGMLFGNTLSAAALGASTITQQFAVHQDDVELRLSRGATCREATFPLIRQSLMTALTPTVNGLAVTGIVHIPGMMTGQILAGQSAPQAAAYQVMINFLIATTACLTVQLLVRFVSSSLVDPRYHRLRTAHLSVKNSSSTTRPGTKFTILDRISMVYQHLISRREFEGSDLKVEASDAVQVIYHQTSVGSIEAADIEPSMVGLQVKSLQIPRLNTTVTLTVRPGDRIGVTGRSGIGKSQVLRCLASLDVQDSEGEDISAISLNGQYPDDLPRYRSEVCIVPQDRPNLEGTPGMFYDEIMSFQRQRRRHGELELVQTPREIAKPWNLPEAVFDRAWSTLSGGEAQRASLAIALATKPRVLLLDEALSAMDDKTSRLVERTLIESEIPIVVVTHSVEQQNRFCTQKVELR